MNQKVMNEVVTAYNEETRQLDFRASEAVSPQEAYEIMMIACPSYNGFSAEKLLKLPSDCTVTLAREGSVCIYVKQGATRLPAKKFLNADEHDKLKIDTMDSLVKRSGGYAGYAGETRIWWE